MAFTHCFDEAQKFAAGLMRRLEEIQGLASHRITVGSDLINGVIVDQVHHGGYEGAGNAGGSSSFYGLSDQYGADLDMDIAQVEILDDQLNAPTDDQLDAAPENPPDALLNDQLDATVDAILNASADDFLNALSDDQLEVPADDFLDARPADQLGAPANAFVDGPADNLLDAPAEEFLDAVADDLLHSLLDGDGSTPAVQAPVPDDLALPAGFSFDIAAPPDQGREGDRLWVMMRMDGWNGVPAYLYRGQLLATEDSEETGHIWSHIRHVERFRAEPD
jgi:hypothetical protein